MSGGCFIIRIYWMFLSRVRFFLGIRSRDMKFMKICLRVFEEIVGKLDLLLLF